MFTQNNTAGDQRKMFTPNPQISKTPHHKPVFCLFGSGAVFARPMLGTLLLVLTLLPATGCGMFKSGSAKDDSPTVKNGAGVFNDDGSLDIPDMQDESTQWSIVLVTLPKPELAPQVLSTVQSTHGLIGAYISERMGKAVILYGRYEGPDDRRALIDLDRVREIQSGTSRPFAAAFLAPPSASALAGSNSEYDLRTVKSRFGPAAFYTLQMGVYGDPNNGTPNASDIREFRQAAERAVLELRGQGEQAFYYHAPLRSMVTIGVFGEQDFDGSTTPAIESMRLRELRKRFPHNYLNGQGIRETVTSATGQRVKRLQPSSLVGIPDS